MNQKLIQQIGRSQRISILNLLKRSKGLPVAEMAEKLGMSYMGVKQHCLQLHREGYLETKRARHATGRLGRPEMLYLLTPKSHELFPQTSNAVTLELLESAKSLYGAAAAEKLLYKLFQNLTSKYSEKIKGDNVSTRSKAVAKLREADGYMSDATTAGANVSITEHHTPILDILSAYPVVERMEEEMFTKLLQVPVRRESAIESGQYFCRFVTA